MEMQPYKKKYMELKEVRFKKKGLITDDMYMTLKANYEELKSNFTQIKSDLLELLADYISIAGLYRWQERIFELETGYC